MKNFKYILASVVLLASCTKYKVGSAESFTVATDKSSYTTSDTVKFTFSGNPDYIIFYSGEAGKNYDYSKTTSATPDSVNLVFSTNTTASSASTQPLTANRVSLFVSSDFTGIMDSVNIKKATWRDITDSATWATTTTTVSSGRLKVDQYRTSGKPVYFAYKYTSDTVKTTYLARKWAIASFMLRSYFKGGGVNYLAAGSSGSNVPFLTAGFTSKSILDSTNNWVFGNTSLTFNAPATGTLPNEDWSISRPFDFTIYTPDLGVGIKTPSTRVSKYSYRFTTPGTYTVTFVGKNQTSEDINQVVRQMTIVVN
ncbi:MAG: DUF5017 domain-containing protein [Lacibacter sp.]